MKNRKRLIGLTGLARSGKDMAGKHLILKHNFHRMAFADPLKEATAATFGVAIEDFHCDTLKDEMHPHWGMTRREMLQREADALREKFGQDLFIRRWLHSFIPLSASENVVITDVRSNAEALAVRELGGLIVRLERDGAGAKGEASKHHTENGISDLLVDRVLVNNGSKFDVHAWLDALMKDDPDVSR